MIGRGEAFFQNLLCKLCGEHRTHAMPEYNIWLLEAITVFFKQISGAILDISAEILMTATASVA